jgi:heat shock protein HslJ
MALAHVGLALLITALAACSASGAGGTHSTQPDNPLGSLEGTSWNAVEVNGTAIAGDVAATERRPQLAFGADGRVSGSDGCNRLTGPYTVKDSNGLAFGPLAGTRMACPGTDELASRFLSALQGTSRWSVVKERLAIYGATDKPLAVFERRKD